MADLKLFAEYIQKHGRILRHNKDLFQIYEGDLLSFVESALSDQLSVKSYEQVKGRITPINILIKIIDKLSKIYQQAPSRTVEGGQESDSALLKWYEDEMNINSRFNIYNEFFNLFKNSLLQPITYNGLPKLRVIPSDRFLPFSNDPKDPTRMTHLIVLYGDRKKETGEIESVNYLFSDDEIIVFNQKGEVLQDVMNDEGFFDGVNPIGRIPFVYANQSQNLLIPLPDTDTKRLTVLIPLLLSDLNAAVMFQAFSIVYGINVESENLIYAPNAFWNLDNENPEKKPEIGMLKPQVDIDQVLNLIQAELSFWLNSRGIRPGSIGELTQSSFASGISKMIDEMDTTEERKKQVEYFTEIESEFWDLQFNYLHPYWVNKNLIDNRTLFSPSAKVITNFAEQIPLFNRGDIVKNLESEVKAGFISRRRAIKRLNPKMTDAEIDELILEIDGERTITIEPFNDEDELNERQMAENQG